MKRQDIISKLMNEGFTEKTLVNLTDKQLHILAERVLSEQYATTSPVTNVSQTDAKTISTLKQQKRPFVTYEGQVSEEEKLGNAKKEEKGDKEIIKKRIMHKIDTKMKKDECIKSEIELLKRIGEEIPEKAQKYYNKRVKEMKKEKVAEPVTETKKLKKWVGKLVENKCFTSKNEIMKLIKEKLNEQEVSDVEVDVELPDFLTYDSIKSAGTETKPAEPTTKPGTRPGTNPGTRPTPKTPFQPGPGPKHNPKASMEEDKK